MGKRMRFARVTGLAGGGLVGAAGFSAVEEVKDWMERGPTRRAARGGTVAMATATERGGRVGLTVERLDRRLEREETPDEALPARRRRSAGKWRRAGLRK